MTPHLVGRQSRQLTAWKSPGNSPICVQGQEDDCSVSEYRWGEVVKVMGTNQTGKPHHWSLQAKTSATNW